MKDRPLANLFRHRRRSGGPLARGRWLVLVVVGSLLIYVWARTPDRRGLTVDGPPDAATPEADAGETGPLLETRSGVWRSPAGLLYLPGSQQGHRLQHVLTHAHDIPNRPGQHGVFDDSDLPSVVALIDEAYRQAVRGLRTHKSVDRQRTVYTVDLQRRIGFVGGQGGRQRGHPPARHLRLVLEGSRVITAYPVIP